MLNLNSYRIVWHVGDKLNNCKLAVSKLVENLTAVDRVHLVAYDDKAEVIFSQGNPVVDRPVLLDQIDAVSTKGCTNLYEGTSYLLFQSIEDG